MYFINIDWVNEHVKHRPANGHKKSFGHVLVIAGSEGKAGAAMLCASAALHSGCGMVTAMIPKDAVTVLLAQCPEVMYTQDENIQSLDLTIFDAILIGPGIGFASIARENLMYVIENYKGPVVIDADALTIIGNDTQVLKSNHIITPHPGEFSRLTGLMYDESARLIQATEFINKYPGVLVLKGAGTLVCQKNQALLQNTTGNDGMATAGSGDVLAGIIVALCAQGYDGFIAAAIGTYMHGLAGDNGVREMSKASLTAMEIIHQLGHIRLTD